MSVSNTKANPGAPLRARKIWDLEDSRRADGGLTRDTDLRGEIHPDLIPYKGYWYCDLKESALRRARLIRSADGEHWESVHLLAWDAGLVGDPKLSVTADGALMVTTFAKALILPTPAPRPAPPEGTGKPERLWTASVT